MKADKMMLLRELRKPDASGRHSLCSIRWHKLESDGGIGGAASVPADSVNLLNVSPDRPICN